VKPQLWIQSNYTPSIDTISIPSRIWLFNISYNDMETNNEAPAIKKATTKIPFDISKLFQRGNRDKRDDEKQWWGCISFLGLQPMIRLILKLKGEI
jgi:hypothetical protein